MHEKIFSVHKTVLLQETIDGLNLPVRVGGSESIVVVDGTFGGGGHSAEICKRYPQTKIIAIDQDKRAWKLAEHKFIDSKCDIVFINENFRNIDKVLKEKKIRQVDGIILDLGLSSDQLSSPADGSGRGFSFMKDEPLFMQMKFSDKESHSEEDITAEEIVNDWSEETLADIIYGYGEERYSRRIAKRIVEVRGKIRIKTTFDLVGIIESVVPNVYKRGKIHFATRTFQALRIAVNDELGALKEGLDKSFKFLKEGGRISVITFHSLEDRIVKRFYKEKEKNGEARLINKKVITASEAELKNNPRSRSAKLRILSRL